MKTVKLLIHGLVIGLSMFIGMTGLLSIPAVSLSAPYAIMHEFDGTGDGFQPYCGAPLISGSTLYGMTQHGGGPDGSGVLYGINTDGSGYGFMHVFKNLPPEGDGTVPRGALALSGATL